MIAYLLNLIDLACTLTALRIGATELNPLMRCVPVMVVYKLVAVGGLLWWLSKRKEHIAVIGMRLIVMVYLIIDLYHISCILYAWRCL